MGMRRLVVCVIKAPTRQDPNHHITHVGVGDSSGWKEKVNVAEVILQLQSPAGDRYYVLGRDGAQADVRLGNCPFCFDAHIFIRTTPDHSRADNLLSLLECVN
jgi:hypothetical protein